MKKFLRFVAVVALVVSIAGVGVSLARPVSKQFIDLSKIRVNPNILKLRGANVVPGIWVNCACSCADQVERRGYLLVDGFTVYIYNNGTRKSGSCNGKIEFYDGISDRKVTLRFTVPPVDAKGYGNASPHYFPGIYLVRKSDGVKISVTFYDPLSKKNYTNTVITKECSVVE